MPAWLFPLATFSIVIALLCCIVTCVDELAGHQQQMWIMNLVWPITMLWAGPLGLLAYYTTGRAPRQPISSEATTETNRSKTARPFWQSVAIAATHCGSGCSLADLIVEWTVLGFPVAVFGSRLAGTWLADFVIAFLVGIAFQYFTIAPMKHLGLTAGIGAALKADTLSLAAWQLGMYGWMAIALLLLFSQSALPKTGPVFWLMMQIAMLFGFLTAYPVNWWLLRKGVKEVM